ncbi:MAG: response regulator [Butyrivibrio sp.]|nr:response regulator [Butyrivibrio sp.]
MIRKILVVEDSEVEGLYIKGLLKRIDNVEETVVRTHEEALELCKENSYALILIDNLIPYGEPEALLESIHKTKPNTYTNAIVLGSASDFSDDKYLEKTGFVNYIEKPIQYNMLRAAVSMYA